MKLFGHSTSTRAALAPRFAGIVLALLSWLTGSAWLMLLACACGGVLITALVLRPRLGDLSVAVSMPLRTMVGAEIECAIEVKNGGSRWSPLVHIVHHVDGLEDVTFRVDPLPARGSASLTFTRPAEQRGATTESTAEVSTTAPLGLRLRKHTLDVPVRLIVHPAEVPVAVPPPRAGADDTQWVVSRAGTDVHGIREWRPGDDASQVHWRSSARRGRLVVLEREVPLPGGLAIVLAADPADSRWEDVVSTGAWTGVAAVRAGRDVTLVTTIDGRSDEGPDDETTVLDLCARSRPRLPDEAQLRRAFSFAGGRGDVAVVAGPSADHGWWPWARGLAAAHDITLVALPLSTRDPA